MAFAHATTHAVTIHWLLAEIGDTRGHDRPHAVRILARTWDRRHLALLAGPHPYDPTTHGDLQALPPPSLNNLTPA